MNKFPKEHDLVSVTIDHVEYYGYVTKVNFDLRDPYVRVEFHPRGPEYSFDFADITYVDFPKKKEQNVNIDSFKTRYEIKE